MRGRGQAILCFVLATATTAAMVCVAAYMRTGQFRQLTVADSGWIWKPAAGWPADPNRLASISFGYASTCATHSTRVPHIGTDYSEVIDDAPLPEPLPGISASAEVGGDVPFMQEEIAVGWPFACLAHRNDGTRELQCSSPDGSLMLTDARDAIIYVPATARGGTVGFAVMPLIPRWPGLVADLLLFPLAWYSVLFLPGAIRRAWRRRRNCCTSRGYPINGQGTCPECAIPYIAKPATI